MRIPLKAYWELLADYIRPQKVRFALLTFLMLGSIGLQLINPQIMRSFIDAAMAGAAPQQLAAAGLAFLGIALLQQGVAIGVRYLGEVVAWTATNALPADAETRPPRSCLLCSREPPKGTHGPRPNGPDAEEATTARR